jgi:hypothetical protein
VATTKKSKKPAKSSSTTPPPKRSKTASRKVEVPRRRRPGQTSKPRGQRSGLTGKYPA